VCCKGVHTAVIEQSAVTHSLAVKKGTAKQERGEGEGKGQNLSHGKETSFEIYFSFKKDII
jgi:hypothetical protein